MLHNEVERLAERGPSKLLGGVRRGRLRFLAVTDAGRSPKTRRAGLAPGFPGRLYVLSEFPVGSAGNIGILRLASVGDFGTRRRMVGLLRTPADWVPSQLDVLAPRDDAAHTANCSSSMLRWTTVTRMDAGLAAIIGAFIGAAGVLSTAAVGALSTRAERKAERWMALRHETYLEYVDALDRITDELARQGDPFTDSDRRKRPGLEEALASTGLDGWSADRSLSRIRLVGSKRVHREASACWDTVFSAGTDYGTDSRDIAVDRAYHALESLVEAMAVDLQD